MYYLFKYHHVMPMQFNNMGNGEKQIVRAFMHYEIDQMNEEYKLLNERR